MNQSEPLSYTTTYLIRITSIVILMLTSIALGATAQADSPRFDIRAGFQIADIRAGSFDTYTSGAYINSDDKQLAGFWLGATAHLNKIYLARYELSALSRWSASSTVVMHSAVIGRRFNSGEPVSPYLAAGVMDVSATRSNQDLRFANDTHTLYSETDERQEQQAAATVVLGVDWLAGARLMLHPSVQLAQFDAGTLRKIQLDHRFSVSSDMALMLNLNYTSWESVSQPGIQLGAAIRF